MRRFKPLTDIREANAKGVAARLELKIAS